MPFECYPLNSSHFSETSVYHGVKSKYSIGGARERRTRDNTIKNGLVQPATPLFVYVQVGAAGLLGMRTANPSI